MVAITSVSGDKANITANSSPILRGPTFVYPGEVTPADSIGAVECEGLTSSDWADQIQSNGFPFLYDNYLILRTLIKTIGCAIFKTERYDLYNRGYSAYSP